MIALLQKELKTLLLAPRFFVLLALFTFMSGFIFLSLIEQFNPLVQRAAMLPNQAVSFNEQVITPHFAALRVLMMFFIPLITMRLFAGEREQGTLPLLLVSPLSSVSIVAAKFGGMAIALSVLTGTQLIFPLLLTSTAEFEFPPVLVGVVGLFFLALSYGAVGMIVSAFSQSQLISGAITFLALFVLHSAEAFTGDFAGGLSPVIQFISPNAHLDDLMKGLLTGGDIVYFLTLIALAIGITTERIDLERGA